MNYFVARCKSRSFYNRTFSVRLSSCSWMITLAWRNNALRIYTLREKFRNFSFKMVKVTSMLVTDVGDKMYWCQLFDVDDRFGHFCNNW